MFNPNLTRRYTRLLAAALLACMFSIPQKGAWAYSADDDAEMLRLYQKQPGNKPAAEKPYSVGIKMILKGNCAIALPFLKDAERLDPRCAGACASQAYCESFLGQDTDAIKSTNKAISIDANNPLYYYRKALYLFSVQQYKDAVEALNRTMELRPANLEALRLRARCYRKMGDIPRSIEDYTTLINKKCYTTEALCERGNLNFAKEDNEAALSDFARALEINPNSGEAFAGRGSVFYRQAKYQQTIDNLTAAIVCGTDKADYCTMTINECKWRLRSKQ